MTNSSGTNPAGTPATEILATNECWELLRSVSVGRLAVWVDNHPDIFPVNYKVDHGTMVFRTGEGTKLHAALGDAPVAMEADGVNAETGVAWSVVIKGQATAVTLTQDVLDTIGLLLFPWEAGQKDQFIRVVPSDVSGRRFTVTSPVTWWTPLDQAPTASSE
ncbi:pyridoxamine 5'-phosphate oxidase family protein [Paenarthrobacter sp. NPDC056912]|uniref:pyridoxamine 5'-phosphate oxidase family protein n=1 Tax=Paenarthrobacter sp. NPDC056912 TaxID=3345965 RepID=UPI00366A7A61